MLILTRTSPSFGSGMGAVLSWRFERPFWRVVHCRICFLSEAIANPPLLCGRHEDQMKREKALIIVLASIPTSKSVHTDVEVSFDRAGKSK